MVESIGFNLVTREDDAYILGAGALQRLGATRDHTRLLTEGQGVRDWTFTDGTRSLFPYNPKTFQPEITELEARVLWPNRAPLAARKALSGTQEEQGLAWFEYSSFSARRSAANLLIAFSFVSTHQHFVLRRDSRAFIRTAPVIMLTEGTSEDDHIGLLGVLNSSTACFWLKQVSQDRGNRGGERSTGRYAWESYYEFTGTKLKAFPLPAEFPLKCSRELDMSAQRLQSLQPQQICKESTPSRKILDEGQAEYLALQSRMVALQEELDWQMYRNYGLLTEPEYELLSFPIAELPKVSLGERAFEMLMAPRATDDEAVRQWFKRHNSNPVTEPPGCWPADYREVVRRRMDIIDSRSDIRLLESPEFKRRWEWDPWEKREKEALRKWLLERCEEPKYWFGQDDTGVTRPSMITIGRLADQLQEETDFLSVTRLYAGEDVELIDVLKEILDAEHVPFLSAQRYRDSGLRKHEQWQETWRLQRQEDETGERLDIKVPPKYTSADFIKSSYWRNRGKLDVPKERFISYPDASPDGDDTLLLGWAGWGHAEQAHALVTLIEKRTSEDGWELERLMPLLAGLDEVLPWVKQWFSEVDPVTGLNPAVVYEGFLEQQIERYPGLSREELAQWRPPKKTRGRKK